MIKINAPIVWLTILTGIFLVGALLYITTGASASPPFLLLFVHGVGWAMAWWILDDCRARRIPTSIDHGWFISHFWLFMLPRHMLRTRGAAGCVISVFLVCAFSIGLAIVDGMMAMK